MVGISFILIALNSAIIEATRGLMASRSFSFEDVKTSQRLTGDNILQVSRVHSFKLCGLKCGKTPECRSFNYCQSQRCELNVDDIFSLGNNNSYLHYDKNCHYYGMQRNYTPMCEEKSDRGRDSIKIGFKKMFNVHTLKKIESLLTLLVL